MEYTDLQIGLKLELELYDDMGDVIRPQLVSELEWFQEEGTIVIAAPIFEGVIYPVRIGTVMNVYFIFKGDLFKFRASVIDRGVKDNIAVLKIKPQGGIQRLQRRQFFRFECRLPVKYRIINSLNPDDSDGIPFAKTYTVDLSGGGMCITAPEKVETGKFMECELQLCEDKVIKLVGKVVRTQREDSGDKQGYRLGIWFRKIENSDREAIIAYIFREQRKLRKKGLI